MPVHKCRGRVPLGPLCLPDGLAVVAEQLFRKTHRAVGLVGDEQHPLVIEGESPQIKGLVVQHVQRQAVVLQRWTAGLVPADVGRIQGNG